VSVDVSVGAADGFFDFVAAPQRTSDAVWSPFLAGTVRHRHFEDVFAVTKADWTLNDWTIHGFTRNSSISFDKRSHKSSHPNRKWVSRFSNKTRGSVVSFGSISCLSSLLLGWNIQIWASSSNPDAFFVQFEQFVITTRIKRSKEYKFEKAAQR
jgi:hypothetical protein